MYLGYIESNKYEVINYKTKKCVPVPKERHLIVENTHEAIISQEDYDAVQSMIKARTHPWVHNHENLFKGIIYCAHLPILAICINYSYRDLCWILVLPFVSLFNIKAFHVHTQRYPLNKYSEYKFNPLSDILTEVDKNFIIEIERKFNIYEVKLKEKL